MRRVQEEHSLEEIRLGPSADGVKMSEVLEEFVEPYGEFAETKEAYHRLLTVATLAWNASLLPRNDPMANPDELVRTLPADVRGMAADMIRQLMLRKEELFPQQRRMIIDFDLASLGTGWHLTVVSTPDAVPTAPNPPP